MNSHSFLLYEPHYLDLQIDELSLCGHPMGSCLIAGLASVMGVENLLVVDLRRKPPPPALSCMHPLGKRVDLSYSCV